MSFKVVGLGEVLCDIFPDGEHLGGAPANFAYHAQALGASARLISRVGRDGRGREIASRLLNLGLPTDLIQWDESAATGTVLVELADDGIPRFTITDNVAWDHIEATEEAVNAVREADVVCFGTLAQRHEPSRDAIQRLLRHCRPGSLRILDVNLRQEFYSYPVLHRSLELANIVKLNREEMVILSRTLGLTGSLREQISTLSTSYGLLLVALTQGPAGSLLYSGGRWSECQPNPVRVVDTVGAGDAFTAAMAIGLLHQMQLEVLQSAANDIASYVCSCSGATPPLPPDYTRKVLNTPT